jgi:hypothetical protein
MLDSCGEPEGEDMSDTMPKARLVRIKCEKGKAGLLYATSPDLRCLLVAEATTEALREAIPRAIRDMYAASGVEVLVSPLEEPQDGETWVALPAAIAREALLKQQA